MRIIMACLSLYVVFGLPSLALSQQGQWQTRPAPQSWGLPRDLPAPVPSSLGQRGPENSRTLDEAVSCSAAMQLATMAAPNWARERGVTDSTNAWLQKVFELGEPQGISGDKVPALVEAEMQRQIDEAAINPANLSRRAFDCASVQP